MELKDFVKETLVQITEGIVEAGDVCKNKGAIINPLLSANKESVMTPLNDSVSMVKFHIGLCESKDSSDKRGDWGLPFKYRHRIFRKRRA